MVSEFDIHEDSNEKENMRVYIGVMDYITVPVSGIY